MSKLRAAVADVVKAWNGEGGTLFATMDKLAEELAADRREGKERQRRKRAKPDPQHSR